MENFQENKPVDANRVTLAKKPFSIFGLLISSPVLLLWVLLWMEAVSWVKLSDIAGSLYALMGALLFTIVPTIIYFFGWAVQYKFKSRYAVILGVVIGILILLFQIFIYFFMKELAKNLHSIT